MTGQPDHGLASSLLLLVLVVVAVVVAVVALRATQGSPPASPPASPTPTPLAGTPSASSSSSPTNAVSSSSAASTAPGEVDPTVAAASADLGGVQPSLVLLSPRTAWRATPGSCVSTSALARTEDGGASWVRATPPATAVASLQRRPGSNVVLVGESSQCLPGQWVATAGGSWRGGETPQDVWYSLPDRPGVVQSPAGGVATPCASASVPPVTVQAVAPDDAAVLCADGTIYVSTRGRLARLTRIEGTTALSFLDRRHAWTLVVAPSDCPGFAVFATVDGGSSWVRSGCVGVAADRARAPGFAWSDVRHGMVVAGDATYTTRDGGRTWSRR